VPICDFISNKHKYSEELVVKILRQLLDAIQWIHLHGFVHLNIHPLTIFNANLTQVNVKLGGFEQATQLSDLIRETTTGEGGSGKNVFTKLLNSLPTEFTGKD
jgi:serine/threonine protein kinase